MKRKVLITSKDSRKIFFQKQENKKTFFHYTTLSQWIREVISSLCIEEYKISWTNAFWINYYLRHYTKQQDFYDLIENGYDWIKNLKTTYNALIAYQIYLQEKDEKNYNQNNLISFIARELRKRAKEVTICSPIMPQNVLEYQIYKLIKKEWKPRFKRKIQFYKGLNFNIEADKVLSFCNHNLKDKEQLRIYVPSKEYFKKALKPIFDLNQVNYYFSSHKTFFDLEISKIFFAIRRVYSEDFSFESLISLINLINEPLLKDYFYKYNINKRRLFEDLTFEQDNPLLQTKKEWFRSILLKEDSQDLFKKDILSQCYSLVNIMNNLINNKKFFYVDKMILFFTKINSINININISKLNTTRQTSILQSIAKEIIIETNKLTNQPIVVTNSLNHIEGINKLIMIGCSANNHQYVREKIILDNINYKNLNSFVNQMSFERYCFTTKMIDQIINQNESIFLTMANFDESEKNEVADSFLKHFSNATELQVNNKNTWFFKDNNHLSQDLIIDEQVVKNLYEKRPLTLSASSLRVLMKDNYNFHIFNGLAIIKNFEQNRLTEALIGTWIHEIIELFVKKEEINQNLPILQNENDYKKLFKPYFDVTKELILQTKQLKRKRNSKMFNNYQLDYCIYYIASKLAPFFIQFNQVLKDEKNNFTYKETEFEIGKKHWALHGNPFVLKIKGKIDLILGNQDQNQENNYFIIDFKLSKRYTQLSPKKIILGNDEIQLLVYLNEFQKHIEKAGRIKGLFYIPYYLNVKNLSDFFYKLKKIDMLLSLSFYAKEFKNKPLISFNQKLKNKAINENKNNFLETENVQIILNFLNETIKFKFSEVTKKGVLSSYPLEKEDQYDPLRTIKPISWIHNPIYTVVKTGTNSEKTEKDYLVVNSMKWLKEKFMGELRMKYIKDWKWGM